MDSIEDESREDGAGSGSSIANGTRRDGRRCRRKTQPAVSIYEEEKERKRQVHEQELARYILSVRLPHCA